jgi:hypothetical protein
MLAPLLGFLLKPKADVLREVDEFWHQFDGKRVVGVQMRTTETYADENLLSIYEHCADLVVGDDDIIFVSTDSIPARDMLIDRFGSRVVYYAESIDMGQVCRNET